MRCARCHCLAAYQARKHKTKFGICLRHHTHVSESLIRDGWIISTANRRERAAA